MKKLLIFALAALMLISLTACGPEDKPKDTPVSADGSVTTADIPSETLPTVADEPVSEDTEPVTLPEEVTEDTTSDEPVESSDGAVTTSSEAVTTTTAATTTKATTTTKASTTTAATTTTAAKTTETAATTTAAADPDEDFEEEDLGWEIIENLDEWLLSMGFDTMDINAD